ncbi:DUF4271 domain-containing protein [uncultured Flavobacterium sp.]|uniref:DUF4271 domain-containing protein n=1 Tax=uncultured Flavobacterium sp. TaxID=165435 RepID=UPI0030CA3646|tara:strand:- start:2607 stop:3263 length:657 start_codon:yes stop_codon:yes gene_type:complete
MIAFELNQRIIENKDWATFLFLFCFAMIAIVKTLHEVQFNDFVNLPFSKKYNTTYKDSSHLFTFFTISLLFVQMVCFSFLIQLFLSHYNYTTKDNWTTFIQIFTALNFFMLCKFYVEKIIATVFDIEDLIASFNLKKITFRTYLALILLPVICILFYNSVLNSMLITLFVGIAMVFYYLFSLLSYQKMILSKMFYFILYLCTLEIGPYYIIYHWFTKK